MLNMWKEGIRPHFAFLLSKCIQCYILATFCFLSAYNVIYFTYLQVKVMIEGYKIFTIWVYVQPYRTIKQTSYIHYVKLETLP